MSTKTDELVAAATLFQILAEKYASGGPGPRTPQQIAADMIERAKEAPNEEAVKRRYVEAFTLFDNIRAAYEDALRR
jgi:hypothetical protein